MGQLIPRPLRNPTALQEVHSGSVLLLCIVVLLGAEEMAAAGWHMLRQAIVIALKLAAGTAPLFKLHALYTLQVNAWNALRQAVEQPGADVF